MAYRLEGIQSPLWTRLRDGPASLLGGSWPITLVAIAGPAHPSKLATKLERMDAWLVETWAQYHVICGPASASSISDNRPL